MFIDVDDITIHVNDTGTGEPVVLLHGWPDTADVWRYQVPALVAYGYRVITPDLRGFGRTSQPQDVAAYTAPRLVADLGGVLDHLGIGPAHVVGHDWGAAVAWMAAAPSPDRVATVVGLSVGHPAALRAAGLRQREKSWYMLLFQFPDIAERWLSDDDFANLRALTAHPDIDEVVKRLREPGAPTASLNPYRAILPPASLIEPQIELPPIQATSMGVWSSGGPALTEKAMTGTREEVAGPWRYERIDGAGHWLQLEAPDRVNALLREFLTRSPMAASR